MEAGRRCDPAMAPIDKSALIYLGYLEVTPDFEADIMMSDIESKFSDHGETVDLMEPLLLSEGSRFRGELTDLALEEAEQA